MLGTAIGAEIVRAFEAKQAYWYGSQGWVEKLVEKLGTAIADGLTTNIRVNQDKFISIFKKIND